MALEQDARESIMGEPRNYGKGKIRPLKNYFLSHQTVSKYIVVSFIL